MSTRLDLSGRVTGLLVFVAGIGLLVFVFTLAHALYNTPAPALPTPPPAAAGSEASPSAAVEIGRSFSEFAQKVLLLFLMCIAGSLIASKGIQLFFAARGHAEPTPERIPQPVIARSATPPSPAPPAPPAPAPAQKTPPVD